MLSASNVINEKDESKHTVISRGVFKQGLFVVNGKEKYKLDDKKEQFVGSNIFKCKDLETGNIVAIKKVDCDIDALTDSDRVELNGELQLQSKLLYSKYIIFR